MPVSNKKRLLWNHLGLISYAEAMKIQERCRDRLLDKGEDMYLLTLEHTGTITLGRTSSREEVFLSDEELGKMGLELNYTDRGGKCTCHVPGQLVGYTILDIKRLGLGVDTLVRNLEACMIEYLYKIGINAKRDKRNPGVWVDDAKIGYIGLHINRNITTHGFALNLNPDMAAFSCFVPCGMSDCRSVSVQELKGSSAGVDEAAPEIASGLGAILGMELVRDAENLIIH